MNSDKNVSFNAAWRNFLIIRAIPYKLGAWIYLDSNQKVTDLDTKHLKKREIEGQWYFCDETTIPDMPLCYYKEVVLSEIENKVLKFLLKKPFEKWKLDALKGKSKHFAQKIEARLGGAIKSEVEKLISKQSYWEALFSLHQILEHRLRKMIMYKSMKLDRPKSKILINKKKEKFCNEENRTFKDLTRIAFLIGAINEDTRGELVSFNRKRNKIAHKILKKQTPRYILKNQCKHGLKLMDALEKHFTEIIPKPKFIRMPKFEVQSFEEL